MPPPRLVRSARDCPNEPEFVSFTFRGARCVAINNVELSPLQVIQSANETAGRHGIGLTRTKEGEQFETPGITLLSKALKFIYDVVFDKNTINLFRVYATHVATQMMSGGYSDVHTQSAIQAIRFLAASASGVVELELHKGLAIFLKLSQVRATRAELLQEEEEVFQPGNGSFSDIEW
jgi:carbamoyl-phosphate synthase